MRRRPPRRLGAVALVAALALGLGGCASSASPVASTGPTEPEQPGTSVLADTACPQADGSSPRTTAFEKSPPRCIDPATRYTATIETSRGDITVELDQAKAPLAVNNFVVLARYHFYDGLLVDRAIPGYAIGAGRLPPPGPDGPGYRFEDELPADRAAYGPGSFLMDNDGVDTNGSKFLLLIANRGIAPKFTIMGRVTSGLDTTMAAIDQTATPTAVPSAPTTIERVTISET